MDCEIWYIKNHMVAQVGDKKINEVAKTVIKKKR